MKSSITTCLAAVLLPISSLHAEETSPEIAGLAEGASRFVVAYNNKDAGAIAGLFTADGEMSDLTGQNLTSGREAIKERYEEVFSDGDVAGLAIEVDSVRFVAPNLAIEDGTAYFTPPEENAPPRSVNYTAVLLKNDAGIWEIASSRSLADVTDASGELFELSKVLSGDWTCQIEDVRLDLAVEWEESGKFLIGEMLTVTPDSEPQTGTIRIGWNASRESIASWMFDSRGGRQQSLWTPTEDGWMLRSEGTTADGETISVNQTLTAVDQNTVIWSATNRVIDGEKQPDSELRLVRRPPVPSSN